MSIMACGGCGKQIEVQVIEPEMCSASVLHSEFLLDDMHDDDMEKIKCPDCGMQWGFRNSRPIFKVVQ